jgi:phosphoribosyl-ATP pyrophosphohydrolase
MTGQAGVAVLDRLAQVIAGRRRAGPDTSYTARLFAGGRAAIAAKLREEAEETAQAALTAGPQRVAAESADLLYHLLVLWAETGVAAADVWAELARREGTSGLAEKAARRPR